MFEKFFHEVTGPYIWGLILLLSLRAIFSSVRKKGLSARCCFYRRSHCCRIYDSKRT